MHNHAVAPHLLKSQAELWQSQGARHIHATGGCAERSGFLGSESRRIQPPLRDVRELRRLFVPQPQRHPSLPQRGTAAGGVRGDVAGSGLLPWRPHRSRGSDGVQGRWRLLSPGRDAESLHRGASVDP